MARSLIPALFFVFLLSACQVRRNNAQTPVFTYELEAIFEVSGRQGIATDGRSYVVSGSQALYRYSLDGELVYSNVDPFVELDGDINHLGDIAIYEGELFTGVENFVNGRGENIRIVDYDIETLQYKRSIPWEPGSGQVEVCGIAVDGKRNTIWLADWLNGQYLYRYDLESGNYEGRFELHPIPKQIQGIMVYVRRQSNVVQ